MDRFMLVRDEDESGVSGTGDVAEVVRFSNGKVAVGFVNAPNSPTPGISSLIIYDSLADVERIHGHGGKSWLRRVS